MNNNYYSKLYPQSSYRKHSSETENKKWKQIQLELKDLALNSPELKQKLRDEIQKQSLLMAKVLLPENMLEKVQNDGHLEKIFSELGI